MIFTSLGGFGKRGAFGILENSGDEVRDLFFVLAKMPAFLNLIILIEVANFDLPIISSSARGKKSAKKSMQIGQEESNFPPD